MKILNFILHIVTFGFIVNRPFVAAITGCTISALNLTLAFYEADTKGWMVNWTCMFVAGVAFGIAGEKFEKWLRAKYARRPA